MEPILQLTKKYITKFVTKKIYGTNSAQPKNMRPETNKKIYETKLKIEHKIWDKIYTLAFYI